MIPWGNLVKSLIRIVFLSLLVSRFGDVRVKNEETDSSFSISHQISHVISQSDGVCYHLLPVPIGRLNTSKSSAGMYLDRARIPQIIRHSDLCSTHTVGFLGVQGAKGWGVFQKAFKAA